MKDEGITAVEMVAIIKGIVKNIAESGIGDEDTKHNLESAIANLGAAEKWLSDCPIIVYK